MAQIIKHKRGNLEGLKNATTRAGELLVVTGSTGLGTIANGADLVFVGIDGSTASPVNKILQGTTVPNLTGGDYNTHVDGIPFFDTNDEKLFILNKGGNVEVKATPQTGGTGIVSGSAQVVLQSANKTGFTGASSITTLGTIATGVWNGTAIANANLANDGITIDGADISLGGSVTTLQLGTSSSTALAGDTTTISTAQRDAIVANTAKTGITTVQRDAIVANTAKVTANSANVVSALSNQATDFGSGRVSGDNFGDVAGSSTITGSFVGDGSALTGLVTGLTISADNGSDDTIALTSGKLTVEGTANEIETTVSNDKIVVGIVTNPTLTGNVTVTGNLNVEGTTTTIDSTQVNIGDRVLELNYARGAGDAGLLVTDVDGSSTVSGSLVWDASSDYWMAGKLGSEKEIALLNAAPTANRVLKANAAGLLVDSVLSDDGTDATFSGDITVTGLAAGSNGAFLYADANEKLQAVDASTAGDIIQWNGSSFVASNSIDGGTF